jgi:hypothetical protein
MCGEGINLPIYKSNQLLHGIEQLIERTGRNQMFATVSQTLRYSHCEENIKVAKYLTAFPDRQWFIDKLNRSIAIAQENMVGKDGAFNLVKNQLN